MSFIYNFFAKLQNFLPILIVLFVIIAIILLVLIVYFVYKTVKKMAKRKPPPKPQPLSEVAENQKKEEEGKGVVKESFLYRHSKLAVWLARFGYYPKGPLTLSFIKAIEVLRDQIGGRDYLYALPWHLVVGPTGSGKTSLLENSDIPQPVGKPLPVARGEKPGIDWWFFDKSIALDVCGSYILKESDVESEDKLWNHLITLLSRFRPKRPMDGVILTIPATELVGDGAFSEEKLSLRAAHIQEKLAYLSNRVGLRFPIYLMVTKCDQIEGFNEFSARLPGSAQGDMLGWSNPYNIGEGFSTSWVGEAFDSIHSSLEVIQQEIYTNGKIDDDYNKVCLFPSAIEKLKVPLADYLSNLFKESGYNKFYSFRGIYFCGDVHGAQAVSEAVAAQEASTRSLKKPKYYFVKDFLHKKVFSELGAVAPDVRRLSSANKRVNYIKVAAVLTIIAGFIGEEYTHKRFLKTADILSPTVTKLTNSMRRLQEMELMPDMFVESSFFMEQIKLVARLTDILDNARLYSIFVPASLMNDLRYKVDDLVTFCYENVLLKSLRQRILESFYRAIKTPSMVDYSKDEDGKYLPPTKMKEFLNLKSYVSKIVRLENATQTYNRLDATKSVRDLVDVIKDVFGHSLHKELLHNFAVHRSALQSVKTHNPVTVKLFQEAVRTRLKQLYQDFISSVFEVNYTFGSITKLEEMIQKFLNSKQKRAPSYHEIKEISEGVNKAIKIIEDPNLNWLENNVFNPGPDFIDLMADIEASQLMGTSVVSNMYLTADNHFSKFKKELSSFRSTITGPLFKKIKNKLHTQPSDGLKEIQKYLNSFMKLAFIKNADDKSFNPRIPTGQMLFWNSANVKQAADLTDDFIKFVAEQLPSYPHDMQILLKMLAREQLHKNVMSLLGRGQLYSDMPLGSPQQVQEEVMRSQVANIRDVSESFSKLLQLLEKSGNVTAYISIRDIILEQVFNVLRMIDHVLAQEKLYSFKDNNFEWWYGDSGAGYTAFKATDATGMQAYLAAQRDRVVYLAKNFAEPVIMLFAQNIFQLGSIDAPLLDKWMRIIEQVNAYQNKKPNSTVSFLEEFFNVTMNNITVNDCLYKTRTNTRSASSSDFFIGRMNAVKQEMYKRCKVLIGQQSIQNYQRLHDFFNKYLSSKFPFVNDSTLVSYGEASPLELRQFFKMFDDYYDSIKLVLKYSPKFGQSGTQAFDFLNQMAKVRKFMEPFLTAVPGVPVGYDFKVQFRVNRKSEVRGNQIIDWSMASGSQVIDFRDPVTDGRWEFGTPVEMRFRWASDSPMLPHTDPRQPALTTSGKDVIYHYDGQWALLRLILGHPVDRQDLATAFDTRPEILSFKIPTHYVSAPTSTSEPKLSSSKVFIRVVPVLKSKDGEEAVAVPRFPAVAPTLKQISVNNMVTTYFSNLPENVKQQQLEQTSAKPVVLKPGAAPAIAPPPAKK